MREFKWLAHFYLIKEWPFPHFSSSCAWVCDRPWLMKEHAMFTMPSRCLYPKPMLLACRLGTCIKLSLSLCLDTLFFMERDKRDPLLLQCWSPDLALLWEPVLTGVCGWLMLCPLLPEYPAGHGPLCSKVQALLPFTRIYRTWPKPCLKGGHQLFKSFLTPTW